MADAPTPEPDPRPKTTIRRWSWAILAVILSIHGVQAVGLYPTLRSVVDDEPVVMVDHAIHEYHGALGARFLRERGTTWGFDPFFMAGYPETPIWDSSSNLAILFQAPAGGYSPRAYKLGVLACSLLMMAAVPAAVLAAGLGAAEAAGATAMAWVYFWAGYPCGLWRSGLFAFTSISAVAGLLLGLCVRFDRRPTAAVWCALAGSGALLFYAHVTAPILLIGGLLPFYLTVARRHGLRWHAAVLGAAGLAVLVNLPWLAPLWQFRGIRDAQPLFFTADSAMFLPLYYLGHLLDGHLGLLLLVTGSAGLLIWVVEGRRTLALTFAGAVVTLMVVTGLGSLWSVTRVLEPVRFLISLNFLLAIPAGTALARATSRLARLAGGGRRGAALAGLGWVAVLVVTVLVMPRTVRTLTGRRPLAVGIRPEMTELVEWLRTNTDNSARILFEDQLRVLEFSDPESVHWTPLLPILLGPDARQFLGGEYQTAFIRHHEMAAFGDYHLGNRAINEWTPDQLREYCNLYNVGWVVCWSPLSRFWFDRYPGARRVATLPRYSSHFLPEKPDRAQWDAMIRRAGPDVATRYLVEGDWGYAVYRVERPHSFFLRGQGRVTAVDANRIELADVVPHEGSILLSIHWLDTWQTDPPLKLGPEVVPLDPVDFVRIEVPGPVARLVLYNGYGRR